jgi:hypothetical protein
MSPITEKSIGVDGQVFAERRSRLRRRVLKGGLISFNNGYSSFECAVRNQSDNGALLSLAETFALPNVFWLLVSENRQRKATVRWRTLNLVGVELV